MFIVVLVDCAAVVNDATVIIIIAITFIVIIIIAITFVAIRFDN